MKRILILALLVVLPGKVFAYDEKEETFFQKLDQSFMQVALMSALAFEGLPLGISSYSRGSATENAEIKELKDYPKLLLAALDHPGTVDYETAIKSLATYLVASRHIAFLQGRRDLDKVARMTLAPHASVIEDKLVKALESSKLEIAFEASFALLALKCENPRARQVSLKAFDSRESGFRALSCSRFGMLHLPDAELLERLAKCLADESLAVRAMAANAIYWLGPEAKSTLPALITYLQTGDDARGELIKYLIIAQRQKENLAIAAISALKSEGQSASASIIRRFPKADEQEQREIIVCLTKIRGMHRDLIPLLERTLSSKNSDLKFAAAFALLHFAPGHKQAWKIIQKIEQETDSTKSARFACLAALRVLHINPEGVWLLEIIRKAKQIPEDMSSVRTAWLAAFAILHADPNQEAASKFIEEMVQNSRDLKPVIKACVDVGATKELVPFLIKLLENEEMEIQALAATALAELGTEASPAIPQLEKLILKPYDDKTYDSHSIYAAAHALARMGKIGIPSLLKATNARGSHYIIAALGSLGSEVSPEVVDRLVQILIGEKSDSETPGFAAFALGRLGEHAKSAVPILKKAKTNDEQLKFDIGIPLSQIPE